MADTPTGQDTPFSQEAESATEPALDMNDFEAGFGDGLGQDKDDAKGAGPDANDAFQDAPEQQESGEPDKTVQPAPAQPDPVLPEADASPQADVQDVPETSVGVVEISASMADDFAELERLSPEAAALAREDSPDGEAVRKRLSMFGAEGVMDRVEMIRDQRQRAVQAVHAEREAMEEHNRAFLATIAADHPELFAEGRTQEENILFKTDMQHWIESLPYAEGRHLMTVFENGRDPREVSAMISRFKKEGRSVREHSRADPTAAMAVTGRGAPMVPQSAGGKDDFEAGWNL